MGDDVTGTGATGGRAVPEGVHVDYPPRVVVHVEREAVGVGDGGDVTGGVVLVAEACPGIHLGEEAVREVVAPEALVELGIAEAQGLA